MTGIGVVSPLGLDAASTWTALCAGRSGVAKLDQLSSGETVDDLPVRIGAQVTGFDPTASLGARLARSLDRFAQFAVVAAREAFRQAGWIADTAPTDEERTPDSDQRAGRRFATVVGTGFGGVATYERTIATLADRGVSRVSPFAAPGMIANSAAASIAMDLGLRGRALCPATACAAGTDAIGIGADLIRLGRADVAVVGGAEAPMSRGVMAAFAAARAASTRNDDPEGACRPFDSDRSGLVMGEGAAILVLEDWDAAVARGAAPIAEVIGYGASNDAHHVTAPDPAGTAAEAAVREALSDGDLRPADVDHVNAHGTGTRLNDDAEASVLTRVLGEGVATTSTKSMTGHLMGAAGAIEAVATVLALRDQRIPPTITCTDLAPECAGLDVVRTVRDARLDVALSTSFGFGGHNAALLLRRT